MLRRLLIFRNWSFSSHSLTHHVSVVHGQHCKNGRILPLKCLHTKNNTIWHFDTQKKMFSTSTSLLDQKKLNPKPADVDGDCIDRCERTEQRHFEPGNVRKFVEIPQKFSPMTWRILIFYDALCPLCNAEISFIQYLDKTKQQIRVQDITASDFDAGEHNLKYDNLMASMHVLVNPRYLVGDEKSSEPSSSNALLVDGTEAFYHIYSAAGLNLIAKLFTVPVLQPLAKGAYRWFAKNRLWLTRRSSTT